MAKKKKSMGYAIAITSVRQIVNLLLVICVVVLLFFLGRSAYDFGYSVFNYKPVSISDTEEVSVIIREDDSVYAIGKQLDEKGLISESPFVFWVQEMVSDYHGQIQPGSYKLSKSQTVDEMLKVLSGASEEEDGSQDE